MDKSCQSINHAHRSVKTRTSSSRARAMEPTQPSTDAAASWAEGLRAERRTTLSPASAAVGQQAHGTARRRRPSGPGDGGSRTRVSHRGRRKSIRHLALRPQLALARVSSTPPPAARRSRRADLPLAPAGPCRADLPLAPAGPSLLTNPVASSSRQASGCICCVWPWGKKNDRTRCACACM